MKDHKAIKINLQVTRRRTTLDSPAHAKPNGSLQTTKAGQHPQKFLQLTINNKRQCSQPSTRNPQNWAKVSEFTSQEDPKWDIITKQIILSDRPKVHHAASRNIADICMPAGEKKNKEDRPKDGRQIQIIRQEINKKHKQINFYQRLLVEKQGIFQKQVHQKVDKYEQYLQNLIRLYQIQLARGQEMAQAISQQQANEMYKQRRRIINKQGKMGLNYTPKRISLLKGVIADSPLLSQSSTDQTWDRKLPEVEHFSFGSKSKANRLAQDTAVVYPAVTGHSGRRKISFDDE